MFFVAVASGIRDRWVPERRGGGIGVVRGGWAGQSPRVSADHTLPSEIPASATTCRVADLLLDIGTSMLISGAHSGRVHRNIDRVAAAWGFQADLFITFTGMMVSVRNLQRDEQPVARFRKVPIHGVHFGIITAISLLTWKVAEETLDVATVEREMERIRKIPHHPRWAILLGIGAACGCLCLLLGGDWKNGVVAFVAALAGMFVRQEVMRLRFNPMIGFIAASFTTSVIAGMDVLHHFGASPEKTLASSVLYLVPGVPLINCAIDLIEGHIPTGIARGVFGGFVLLCIAVGMTLSILLLGIHNF